MSIATDGPTPGRLLRLSPGVPDVVFGLVLVSVLVGGRYRLLNDPGSFWHARLGRDILARRAVPWADTLTYTRDGVAWVDQSWLFDLGLAGLVDLGGWSLAALAAGLLLAGLYGAVARGLLFEGRSPLVALAVTVLAAGIGSIHFLVRPHLLTLVFFWTTLRLCRLQHERGGWWLVWTLPLTALWSNVHGGFLAGPLTVFVAGFGHAVSGPWTRERRREAAWFGLIGVGGLLAALCNPYGPGLYRHVLGLLVSSGVTELIEEYQPIPFGKPDARVVEWVILALIAVPMLSPGRMTRYELVQALVWLHLSLASVRHAPLFGLAVAPGLARMLDGLLASVRRESDALSTTFDRSWTIWPGVAALGLGLATAGGVEFGGFDSSRWPIAGLASLNQAPSASVLFHEQDWGGMVASECRPARRSFIDDRFELYGKDGVLRYLNALQGGPDWEAIRDQYGVGLVWVRPDRGLARRLRADPSWRVRHKDPVSTLFERIRPVERGSEVVGR